MITKLETQRLILRKPKLSDWKDIVEGLNDLKVSQSLKFVPYPYKKKNALYWIKYNLKNWKKKNGNSYVFFIELKTNKKIIGETGIYVNPKNKKASTGSWINRKYWKKGYLLETKIPVFDFIFNKLKLRKIETSANKENVSSNNLQKKLGFKYEGTRIKSETNEATGKIHDVNLYGLFKEDWKKIEPKLKKRLNEKIKRLEAKGK